MQAVGMVNDHVVGCFRHDEVKKIAQGAAADADKPGLRAKVRTIGSE
jgi:DNA-3-methyladenine glycosylase I